MHALLLGSENCKRNQQQNNHAARDDDLRCCIQLVTLLYLIGGTEFKG